MSADRKRFDDCKDLFAILSQYLDAELPEGDCETIRAHIAGCPRCVKFVESLQKTIALCRAGGAAEEPPPLEDDVRRELLEAYQNGVRSRARVNSEKS